MFKGSQKIERDKNFEISILLRAQHEQRTEFLSYIFVVSSFQVVE